MLGTGVSVQSKPGWAVSAQVAWGPERALGEPSFPPGLHLSPAGPSPRVREQGELGTWERRAEGSPPPEALNLPGRETELDSVRFQREFGQRCREAARLGRTDAGSVGPGATCLKACLQVDLNQACALWAQRSCSTACPLESLLWGQT